MLIDGVELSLSKLMCGGYGAMPLRVSIRLVVVLCHNMTSRLMLSTNIIC
jgi:hypothetical protein